MSIQTQNPYSIFVLEPPRKLTADRESTFERNIKATLLLIAFIAITSCIAILPLKAVGYAWLIISRQCVAAIGASILIYIDIVTPLSWGEE